MWRDFGTKAPLTPKTCVKLETIARKRRVADLETQKGGPLGPPFETLNALCLL